MNAAFSVAVLSFIMWTLCTCTTSGSKEKSERGSRRNSTSKRSGSRSRISSDHSSPKAKGAARTRRTPPTPTRSLTIRFFEGTFSSFPNYFIVKIHRDGSFDFKMILEFSISDSNHEKDPTTKIVDMDIRKANMNERIYSFKAVESAEESAKRDRSLEYKFTIENEMNPEDRRYHEALRCEVFPKGAKRPTEQYIFMPGENKYDLKVVKLMYKNPYVMVFDEIFMEEKNRNEGEESC